MFASLDLLRLAPEETSNKVTEFEHNAVTCICMKTNIPVHFVLKTVISLIESNIQCEGDQLCHALVRSSLGACSLLLRLSLRY